MPKYVTVSTTNTWDTKYVTVSNTWAIKDTMTSYFTKYTLCTAKTSSSSSSIKNSTNSNWNETFTCIPRLAAAVRLNPRLTCSPISARWGGDGDDDVDDGDDDVDDGDDDVGNGKDRYSTHQRVLGWNDREEKSTLDYEKLVLLFHDYLLLQTFIQFIVEMERLPQPGINFRPDFLHRTCWSAGLMVARMANSSHMWLPSKVCTILRGQQTNSIKIAVNDVWPKIAQGHLGKSREWGVRRSEPARRPKAERPWGP